MGIRDIASFPVAGLALPDSALFMWVVSCNLKDGLAVGKSWGFEFKTIVFVWSKTVKDGSRPAIGLGYWTRQSVEVCHQRLAQALERGGQAVRPDSAGSTLGESPGGLWQDRGVVARSVRRAFRPDSPAGMGVMRLTISEALRTG
jgi:hypothetical protein